MGAQKNRLIEVRALPGSMAAQLVSTLASGARGPMFDPRSRRGKVSVSEQVFLSAICRDDTIISVQSTDRDVNWVSTLQGKSPPVQVKEPYSKLDN